MVLSKTVRARPLECRTPLLDNPGKGCATFQRFNGDPLNRGERWSEEGPLAFPRRRYRVAPAYLPSAIAYCRWFWEVFEPEEGVFDFTMVERALKTARARGQTLQVRMMPFGATNQPQLPAWYRRRYRTRIGTKPERRYVFLEPEYEGGDYFRLWGRAIGEFGRKFDGHPDLESVDLAFIGPWGEGAGDMPAGRIEQFVETYARSHRKTPLLANVDGRQFAAGVGRGTGWRCDCFGDLRNAGPRYVPGRPGWNHTFDAYPQAVARAGAAEVWRTRPVVFETCGTPLSWHKRGYDLELIMRQGLKFHASVFMPKSCPIPRPYLKPLAEFCDRIGYRFVLRQALWRTPAPAGKPFPIQLWIENTGVAPVYRRYRLAFRFSSGKREAAVPVAADPRKWLPGDIVLDERVRIPKTMGRGTIGIAAGLVHPATLEPAVKFANEGVRPDGWLPLGRVQ